MPEQQQPWWQRAIVYQIYPRSFMDADGDGVGDLRGIAGRLDHLERLGVDAVWISPFYPSPMADFGYDIKEYTDVDPLFGTLDDFDHLVREARRRGLRVILDYVPNHTSGEHPWFVESRSSRDSPKRDWYIWRDPAPGGGPPNNWVSEVGTSAWEWDEKTGQYYYHAFLPKQPDLNWRNPAVREAMYDVLRFWMGRGVDGFRVDVIWHLIKDAAFRDNPINPLYKPGQPPNHKVVPLHSTDQPEVFDVIEEMRHVLDSYGDRVLIGEIYLPVERLVAYYGADLSGVHMPFNFQLIAATSKWDSGHIAQIVHEYEAALPEGGWPNWVLGNHDNPRIASRIGPAQARVAAMLLLTLRGTPTLYYGDEIGMEDVPIPPERAVDPWERHNPGLGFGRDPERTPMQWDRSPNAGFTTSTPWLPLAEDWPERNVAVLSEDQKSILTLYRRLIELRRAEPALTVGGYAPVATEGDVLTYMRREGGRSFLVALNMDDRPKAVVFPGGGGPRGRIALSTHLDREGEPVDGELDLRPDEGVVIALGGPEGG